MSFRGDFKALGKMVESIGKIAQGDFVTRSASALGDMAYDKARASVAAGEAPSGRKWKPNKDGSRPLTMLAGSLALSKGDTNFKIESALPWAIYHQTGAKKVTRPGGFKRGVKDGKLVLKRVTAKVGWRLPKRPILPRGNLPKAWSEPMIRRLLAEWTKTWR